MKINSTLIRRYGQYDPALDSEYHCITIRQLLAHTSGMPHYQPKDVAITAPIRFCRARHPQRSFVAGSARGSLSVLVTWLCFSWNNL
ncbi:MAG: beta-lactamase family protein [Gammaproteobacteria bacterium]|nr:beta-lactamase family protein [Gammaproteobacteria bacterium]MBU1555961.1 beta-lactamase family protein [Gammaproteobacteria bacterium]